MKLLADIICGQRASAQTPIQHLADLLRRPAQNHAPSSIDVPMVERFVFGRAESEALWPLAQNISKRPDMPVRLPLPTFWMEMNLQPSMYGFYVSMRADQGVAIRCFSKYMRTPPVGYGIILLDSKNIIARYAPAKELEFGTGKLDWDDFMGGVSRLFEAAITSLTVTRMAVVRKTHPFEDHKNIKEIFRRNAQRGYPVYSMNQVTFNFPKSSHQGAEVGIKGHGSPKRGHWVVGHWRLIVKEIQPEWVWVSPHTRGDFSLGAVCKERVVKSQ